MKTKVTSSILALTLFLVACSTSWVTQALNILAVVTPAAVNVLTLISAFSGNPVNQSAVATITNDVNVVTQLVKDYANASTAAQPAALAQLNAALAVTQKDLGSFLDVSGVKDVKKRAEVQAVVTFVIAEVAAVQAILPNAPVTFRGQEKPLSAKQFRKNFNVLVAPLDPALELR